MKKKIAVIVALVILGSLVLCLIGVLFSDTTVDKVVATSTMYPTNTLEPTNTSISPTLKPTILPTWTTFIKIDEYMETLTVILIENPNPIGALITLKQNLSREPDAPCKEELLILVDGWLNIFYAMDSEAPQKQIDNALQIAYATLANYELCDANNQ